MPPVDWGARIPESLISTPFPCLGIPMDSRINSRNCGKATAPPSYQHQLNKLEDNSIRHPASRPLLPTKIKSTLQDMQARQGSRPGTSGLFQGNRELNIGRIVWALYHLPVHPLHQLSPILRIRTDQETAYSTLLQSVRGSRCIFGISILHMHMFISIHNSS
jgi:hypothetical protein